MSRWNEGSWYEIPLDTEGSLSQLIRGIIRGEDRTDRVFKNEFQVDKIYIVGHSYGAYVGMKCIQRKPDNFAQESEYDAWQEKKSSLEDAAKRAAILLQKFRTEGKNVIHVQHNFAKLSEFYRMVKPLEGEKSYT